MKSIRWYAMATVMLLVFTTPAFAELGSAGIMNDVLSRFHGAASGWASALEDAASRLFWSLVLISMIWTFGLMALRKADLAEFFAEFVRFTVFTGFFWWLLTNAVSGVNIGGTIIDSLQTLGADAGGLGTTKLGPSSVVDIGFELYDLTVQATDELSWREMGTQIVMLLMALAILIVLALVAVNMLLLLAASWVLLYAGVFFLGFGGSRWTSDIAINYFKTVLGVAAQLLTMVLIVAIGKQFLVHYAAQISTTMATQELAVMLVVAVILLFLVNKVPPLVSGIVTGAGISAGAGIGSFGAGAVGGVMGGAVGAAGIATAAAGVAGSAFASVGAQAAGGASAIMEAYRKASGDIGSSGGVLAAARAGGVSPGGEGESGGPRGGSPLARATGLGGTQAGGGSSSAAESSGEGRGTGASRAARVAVGVAGSLAQGSVDVAKAKVGSMVESAKERIADTTGGRVAEAIRSRGADMRDGGSASQEPVDMESEIEAFVNRDGDRQPD